MTTYQSATTNPFDAPPTVMPIGEITYPDGHRVLVPQPVKFQVVPAEPLARMCMSCLRVGVCAWNCEDRLALDRTSVDVVPVTRAVEASEIPAEGRPAVPRVPVWALACIVCGLVLVAIGLVLRDPVARTVWEAIQR